MKRAWQAMSMAAKWQLAFIPFILLAYLPLASMRFALKNDAFIFNYPPKHFFSECLAHGIVPTWNPYLNYGFPMYADPGFAWWHPLTWVLGIIGYTPQLLSIEVLLYLLIAATGMFRLTKYAGANEPLRFFSGCMYAASGFFVGNLQHINFLTAAAALPWVIYYWLNLQKSADFWTVFKTTIAIYLFVTAGHPAMPIAALYYSGSFALLYFLLNRKTIAVKQALKNNLLLIAAVFVLLLPVILAWWQLLPYYNRTGVLSQFNLQATSFTLPAYVSFISPLSTIKGNSFFSTDVSMRNGYLSLLALGGLYLRKNLRFTKIDICFLVSGILLLLLSFGGTWKETVYGHMPLLNHVRTNGEFRVYGLLSIIFLSIRGLSQLTQQKMQIPLKNFYRFLALGALVAACAFALVIAFNKAAHIPVTTYSKNSLKDLLDQITLLHTVLLGCLTVVFLSALYSYTFSKHFVSTVLVLLGCADLILNTWAMLPVTGVGQKSTQQLSQILQKQTKGFPVPDLQQPTQGKAFSADEQLRVGDWGWYDKQILHAPINYPSQIKPSTANVLEQTNKPWIFLQQKPLGLKKISFQLNYFKAWLQVAYKDTLVIRQNFYPDWTAQSNKQALQIIDGGDCLLIPVTPDDTLVHIQFKFFSGYKK